MTSSPSRPAPQVATPGPWRVLGDGVTIAQDRKTHRTHVARAIEIYGDRAQREANARLLAAAPAMRDALRSAVAILEELITDDHPTALEALAAARSALALAQGAAPINTTDTAL